MLIFILTSLLSSQVACGHNFISSNPHSGPHSALEGDNSIPKNEEFVFQSAVTCGTRVPGHLLAKRALLCGQIKATRECMGLPEGAPLIAGRGCSGGECILSLDAKGSECFLMHLTPRMKDKVVTNRFCDPEAVMHDLDADAGHSVTNDCLALVPSGVTPSVWVDCSGESPIVHLALNFHSEIEGEQYFCALHPKCDQGSFKSRLVCRKPISETISASATVANTSFTPFLLLVSILVSFIAGIFECDLLVEL